jgi:Thioredoxin like C-terminal domain
MYEPPARLRLNEWALSGDWTVKKETAVLNKPNGSIAYHFHARDLYQLIRQPKPIADRQFEIEFLGSGVEVFPFTFG